MAININLQARREVEPATQPIARTFVGWDRDISDDELWNANRGAWMLPDEAAEQQFATFSHDGTIRLVAEIEGIENVSAEGRPVRALMGRVLRVGDPVRDRLVGQQVDDADSEFSFFDTTELDQMSPAERYAPRERDRRTFLITFDPEQWFWSPEDEQAIISRTGAGAIVRETWSAGGRRQGIEPGDRVYLLQGGRGPQGVRGRGVVSSRIYQGEHFDDPRRTANYIDIDWDLVLPPDRLIDTATLRSEVPGYAWNPQKGGVELHQPMATQMEELWSRLLGSEQHPHVESDNGWEVYDARRREVRGEARRRVRAAFEADGWEVEHTGDNRPYCGVASRDGVTRYLFGRAAETQGRPVIFNADELEFITSHPGECVMGVVSDATFDGGSVVANSGNLHIVELPADRDGFEPLNYRFWPEGHEQAR